MFYWTDENLEKHYRDHPAGKDKVCWMELLAKTTQVTKSEYQREAISVANNAWIRYRGQEADRKAYYDAISNPGNPPYHDEARYYTDARLD